MKKKMKKKKSILHPRPTHCMGNIIQWYQTMHNTYVKIRAGVDGRVLGGGRGGIDSGTQPPQTPSVRSGQKVTMQKKKKKKKKKNTRVDWRAQARKTQPRKSE
jgi:formylmethanofuran:tetrahydromethanopterin formyltransferase